MKGSANMVYLELPEMPENCNYCRFFDRGISACNALEGYARIADYTKRRHSQCPLKEVEG